MADNLDEAKASDSVKYQADGTIHVRFGGEKHVVTFIPDKYVEQGGDKFIVFTPQCPPSGVGCCPVVKVCRPDGAPKGVEFTVEKRKFETLVLVAAAVKATKVTVLVSKGLELEEIIVPAIPAKSAT